MTISAQEPRSSSVPSVPHGPRATLQRTAWHVAGAGGSVRTHGTALVGAMPGALRAIRAGARSSMSMLQVLPDPTLRWLIAGSAGMAAGLFAAGAPRVITTLGMAPVVAMGAAIALRPAGRDVTNLAHG